MRRRSLLAAAAGLGAGSAGCLGAAGYRAPGGRSSAYRIADLSVAASTDGPDHRYVLEPDAFLSADAVERKRDREGRVTVRDVAELDPPVRRAVETAVTEDRWRANHLPEGLARTVERVDLFTGLPVGGTHTHVGLELYRFDPAAPPAVAFSARVPDADVTADSPGAVEFAIENVSDAPREVFSGTVPPFGVLLAGAVGGDEQFLLWRPYEEEGCVFVDEDGIGACAIGIRTVVAPGERVARRYEVLPDGTDVHPSHTRPPGAGTYLVSGTVNHSREFGAPGSTLSYRVRFALEPA